MSGDEYVGWSQREALLVVLQSACSVAKLTREERFYALLALRGELNAWLNREGIEVQKLEDSEHSGE